MTIESRTPSWPQLPEPGEWPLISIGAGSQLISDPKSVPKQNCSD